MTASSSLHGSPAEEPGSGLIYQRLSKMNEGGLWEMVRLCLWELYEGKLEGELLYWGP
jgi:hypothetical protein